MAPPVFKTGLAGIAFAGGFDSLPPPPQQALNLELSPVPIGPPYPHYGLRARVCNRPSASANACPCFWPHQHLSSSSFCTIALSSGNESLRTFIACSSCVAIFVILLVVSIAAQVLKLSAVASS